MADYGKSETDVVQLKKEIDDFDALISSPRGSIVTRSQATQQLESLIRNCNRILTDKIDKLMLLLQNTQPKVYNTYKAARVIVDLRKGQKIVEEE